MFRRAEASRLSPLLQRTHRLLRRTAPRADDYDVAWHGPYFILRSLEPPRRREWHPTRFLLYDGSLHASLTMGWSAHRLTWRLGTEEVQLEHEGGFESYNEEWLWRCVLGQVVQKLAGAVRHPDRYNRRIERLLPLRCRTGTIERRLTWRPGSRLPMGEKRIARIEKTLRAAAGRSGLRQMTFSKYLKTAATALGAAYKDLEGLSPLKKYRRRADTRHGGLLDLPRNDAGAFARWYRSRAWAGCHPWEIVFGHPHGILLAPIEEGGLWRFSLSVDSLGLYVKAAQMAEALLERGVPLLFYRSEAVFAALRGADFVEVGPFFDQIRLQELEEIRPGARRLVRWDAIPRIEPASQEDLARIAHVEATGIPPRREADTASGCPDTDSGRRDTAPGCPDPAREGS